MFAAHRSLRNAALKQSVGSLQRLQFPFLFSRTALLDQTQGLFSSKGQPDGPRKILLFSPRKVSQNLCLFLWIQVWLNLSQHLLPGPCYSWCGNNPRASEVSKHNVLEYVQCELMLKGCPTIHLCYFWVYGEVWDLLWLFDLSFWNLGPKSQKESFLQRSAMYSCITISSLYSTSLCTDTEGVALFFAFCFSC